MFDNTRINISLAWITLSPTRTSRAAAQSKQCREFADKYDILNFFDVGEHGR